MAVIAIAGATGFVGKHLIERLREKHSVIALSRSPRPSAEGVEWRRCDLFSLLDAEVALQGVEVAYYLVHSMLPSAHLTQGSFEDMDLIVADNFARAAAKAGVRRVVYLGGLTPPAARLSKHLRSRLEVEQTLRDYGTPVTALRASMVIGPGGSSFDLLTQMVRRLPVMIAPAWTLTRTQPIALDDLLRVLVACAVGDPPETVEVGGPDVLTYKDMLRTVGEVLGKPRPMLSVSALTPRLSKLWVELVTGAPRQLVGPLIDSLRHDMVVRDDAPQRALGRPETSFRAAVESAVAGERERRSASWHKPRRERDVRSVQRLPLPPGKDARWVADEYMRWLPRLFRHVIRVRVDATGDCRFFFVGLQRPILDLRYAADRSTPERSLFYIEGGVLAKGGQPPLRGRLEFRVVAGGGAVIAAIHDFRPALPWRIYKYSQALVHLAVMRLFGRHLARRT